MSFAGSIQMIFFPMLTCKIGFQGGPDKMAAANFLWLHLLNNRSSIQSLFFIILIYFYLFIYFFWRSVGLSCHFTGNPGPQGTLYGAVF